jgi:hypothetical protein
MNKAAGDGDLGTPIGQSSRLSFFLFARNFLSRTAFSYCYSIRQQCRVNYSIGFAIEKDFVAARTFPVLNHRRRSPFTANVELVDAFFLPYGR